MYSELRFMEAMKIFSDLRLGESSVVRIGAGIEDVMRYASKSRIIMRVRKRGLGRKYRRRMERDRSAMVRR